MKLFVFTRVDPRVTGKYDIFQESHVSHRAEKASASNATVGCSARFVFSRQPVTHCLGMKTRLTQSEDKRDLEGVLRPVRWILLTSPLWLATLVFSHTVFSRVSIFSSRSEFKNPPLNNLKKTGLLWRLHSRNHDHRDNLPQPRQLWGVWIFSVVSCFLGGFLFVLRLKRVQHTFTASRNESVPSDDLGLVWYWRMIRRLWLFFFFFL